jgi:hypothetical protein
LSIENDKGGMYSALCRPAQDRACFGCCPPIRPAGYDHLDHRPDVERMLRDNTHTMASGTHPNKWISGEYCWGLGYLDSDNLLAGCLLHPAQNQGKDLRDLTGYGDKCRRELCREAVRFERLSPKAKTIILDLTDGLDAFEYSSHRTNPAFRLLLWPDAVVEQLAEDEPGGLDQDTYFKKYKYLAEQLDPLVHGYAVEILLPRMELTEIGQEAFLNRFLDAVKGVIARHKKRVTPPYDNRPFVHQLEIPSGLVSFLRHGLKWQRALPSDADMIGRELEALLIHLS